MKIKYMIMVMTALLQITFLSSCTAPSPQVALKDAVSGQVLQEQQAADPGRSDPVAEEPQEEIYVKLQE